MRHLTALLKGLRRKKIRTQDYLKIANVKERRACRVRCAEDCILDFSSKATACFLGSFLVGGIQVKVHTLEVHLQNHTSWDLPESTDLLIPASSCEFLRRCCGGRDVCRLPDHKSLVAGVFLTSRFLQENMWKRQLKQSPAQFKVTSLGQNLLWHQLQHAQLSV